MKIKNKNQEREVKETPVRSGDTRPDHQPEGKKSEPFPVMKDIKNKVSQARGADINSLENHKNAMSENAGTHNSGETAPLPGPSSADE